MNAREVIQLEKAKGYKELKSLYPDKVEELEKTVIGGTIQKEVGIKEVDMNIEDMDYSDAEQVEDLNERKRRRIK